MSGSFAAPVLLCDALLMVRRDVHRLVVVAGQRAGVLREQREQHAQQAAAQSESSWIILFIAISPVAWSNGNRTGTRSVFNVMSAFMPTPCATGLRIDDRGQLGGFHAVRSRVLLASVLDLSGSVVTVRSRVSNCTGVTFSVGDAMHVDLAFAAS